VSDYLGAFVGFLGMIVFFGIVFLLF